jgi:hypothetical protein
MVTETPPLPQPSDDADGPGAQSKDRLTIRPIFLALILIGLFFGSGYVQDNFERYGAIAFLIFMITVLIAFLMAITSVLFLLVQLAMRRWRTAMSIAVALILFVGCFLARFEINLGIDIARFKIFKGHYVSALRGPTANAQSPMVLLWGFFGYFLTGEHYRMLVYDEADEIGAPDGSISGKTREAIQAKIYAQTISGCKITTRQLERHFYIVEVLC